MNINQKANKWCPQPENGPVPGGSRRRPREEEDDEEEDGRDRKHFKCWILLLDTQPCTPSSNPIVRHVTPKRLNLGWSPLTHWFNSLPPGTLLPVAQYDCAYKWISFSILPKNKDGSHWSQHWTHQCQSNSAATSFRYVALTDHYTLQWYHLWL